MISAGTIAIAVAAVIIASLAYRFAVKWLAFRQTLVVDDSKFKRLEATLAKLAELHNENITQLTAHIEDLRTRTSTAKPETGRVQRGFGR